MKFAREGSFCYNNFMKAVVQRVKSASVSIGGELFSSIENGLLVLLGVEKGDTSAEAEYICNKLLKLRIFEDENEKMNYSVSDINGGILIVSQFTLAGSVKKGLRPSFDNAMLPKDAEVLYEKFVEMAKESGLKIQTGKFGAMMDVALINDGPVTFIIEKSCG